MVSGFGFTLLSLLTTAICASPCIPKTSTSTKSWAGANNYFAHALRAGEQAAWVKQIATDGAKVVRLWVTGLDAGCTKSSTNVFVQDLEPNLGEYHDDVLVAIDRLLSQLVLYGIKAIISPHDANQLGGGGCDAYCNAFGNDNFYTTDEAWDAYSARLEHILSFVSPNFNKPWSQLHEAILAFDVQNEPFIGRSDLAKDNDPTDWLCGHAGYMASLIDGSGVLVATGGVGGSEYYQHTTNEMPKAVQCDAIDIISVHGYQDKNTWSPYIPSLLNKVNKKLLIVEEWGVGSNVPGPYPVQNSEFKPIYDLFNHNGIPWLYWSVISGFDETQNCKKNCDACCGQNLDGFEIGLNSTKGNVSAGMKAARTYTAAQNWSGLLY